MLLLRQQLEFPGWCWWDGHYRPSGLATRLLKTRTTVLLPGTPSSLAPWNDAHAPKLGRGYRSSSDNFRTPISFTRYPHRPFRRWNDPRRRGGYRTWSDNFRSPISLTDADMGTPIVLRRSHVPRRHRGRGPAAIFFAAVIETVN